MHTVKNLKNKNDKIQRNPDILTAWNLNDLQYMYTCSVCPQGSIFDRGLLSVSLLCILCVYLELTLSLLQQTQSESPADPEMKHKVQFGSFSLSLGLICTAYTSHTFLSKYTMYSKLILAFFKHVSHSFVEVLLCLQV